MIAAIGERLGVSPPCESAVTTPRADAQRLAGEWRHAWLPF